MGPFFVGPISIINCVRHKASVMVSLEKFIIFSMSMFFPCRSWNRVLFFELSLLINFLSLFVYSLDFASFPTIFNDLQFLVASLLMKAQVLFVFVFNSPTLYHRTISGFRSWTYKTTHYNFSHKKQLHQMKSIIVNCRFVWIKKSSGKWRLFALKIDIFAIWWFKSGNFNHNLVVMPPFVNQRRFICIHI